jgi:hypothetical protein
MSATGQSTSNQTRKVLKKQIQQLLLAGILASRMHLRLNKGFNSFRTYSIIDILVN